MGYGAAIAWRRPPHGPWWTTVLASAGVVQVAMRIGHATPVKCSHGGGAVEAPVGRRSLGDTCAHRSKRGRYGSRRANTNRWRTPHARLEPVGGVRVGCARRVERCASGAGR
eukprot:CAMPEP_0195636584 /NCGR_PEP_ID=MMETSP0815-20121206/23943_1 /TAXON_ID=97485 /ORGANISM="Prymnesium parvum, Strain Texoma1" /LENGTH=111 /DNA_ID=CAMNT_0040778695 /DNA_START=341 /DNA_END=673 /DNA_ORIENTATION=-